MTQEQVWDMVTESAKAKFDLESFQKEMEENYGISDKHIVFDALTRYATNQENGKVIDEIHADMASKGMFWPKEKMAEFFSNKEVLWKKEIIAMNNSLAKFNDNPVTDHELMVEHLKMILANS